MPVEDDRDITSGPGWRWVTGGAIGLIAFLGSLLLADIRGQLVEVNDNVTMLRLTIVRLEEGRKSNDALHGALTKRQTYLESRIDIIEANTRDRWTRSQMVDWAEGLDRENPDIKVPRIK